jgi:hypothetical protein
MDSNAFLNGQLDSLLNLDHDVYENPLFYINLNNNHYILSNVFTEPQPDTVSLWNLEFDTDSEPDPVDDPLTNWYFYDFSDPTPYVECDDDRRYDLEFESNN